MTEKQQKFADEYIISLNATQAYKKAYPSVKKDAAARASASQLLTNPNVKAYIDERLEKLKSERVADQQEVLEFLTAVMRGEVTEPLLVLDGEGTQKVVNLGKRFGLFVDKQEITQRTIEIKVGEWDDDD